MGICGSSSLARQAFLENVNACGRKSKKPLPRCALQWWFAWPATLAQNRGKNWPVYIPSLFLRCRGAYWSGSISDQDFCLPHRRYSPTSVDGAFTRENAIIGALSLALFLSAAIFYRACMTRKTGARDFKLGPISVKNDSQLQSSSLISGYGRHFVILFFPVFFRITCTQHMYIFVWAL